MAEWAMPWPEPEPVVENDGCQPPVTEEGPGLPVPQVDWAVARSLASTVSDRILAERELRRDGIGDPVGDAITGPMTDEEEEDLARIYTKEAAADYDQSLSAQGLPPLGPVAERALVAAVMQQNYGLGRLREYLRDEVEDVLVFGWNRVELRLADGTREQVAPFVDSNAALVEKVAEWASRYAGRSFDAAEHRTVVFWMPVDGHPMGVRVSASREVGDVPTVAIRRPRLINPTLDELRELGTLNLTLQRFLQAAVAAGASLLISGAAGAGKTVLLSALARELPPDDHVLTVESSRELGLYLLRDDGHPWVTAWESIPPNSDGAGGTDLSRLVDASLTFSVQTIVLGEARGPEIRPVLKAMSDGTRALGTLHAKSAAQTFDRVVQLAGEADPPQDPTVTGRQFAQGVDLVIHLSVVKQRDRHQNVIGMRRVIDQVAEVVGYSNDAQAPSMEVLFASPDPVEPAESIRWPTSPYLREVLEHATVDGQPYHFAGELRNELGEHNLGDEVIHGGEWR